MTPTGPDFEALARAVEREGYELREEDRTQLDLFEQQTDVQEKTVAK